jgi:hypothetical protein
MTRNTCNEIGRDRGVPVPSCVPIAQGRAHFPSAPAVSRGANKAVRQVSAVLLRPTRQMALLGCQKT